MAKATLEFDLEEPHERQSHLRAAQSDNLFAAVSQTLDDIRKELKYPDDTKDKDAVETLEWVRTQLLQALEDNGIDFEFLWN